MTSRYDQLNGWGPDYDYWLALARDLAPEVLTDVGCGTGQLTVLFAHGGYRTVGVDPSPQMLHVARSRTGHELVTWIAGYASDVPTASADLVTMTGHVSQVFHTDEAWVGVLRQIHRCLRPNGRVAFDMRNLRARGWLAWNRRDSRRFFMTSAGRAECWYEVTDVSAGLVTYNTIVRSLDGAETSVETDVLRFRDELELRRSLAQAGFVLERLCGDFDGAAATASSRELIATARRVGN